MHKNIKIILLLSCILFLLSGCCYVNNSSLKEISNQILNNKRKLYNQNTQGFKYYLPRNMTHVSKDEYNEILRDKKYSYYLYADLVSYYNKKESTFEKKDVYYSDLLENGVIYVSDEDNDKYLINITYNYASIEVECEKVDLKDVYSNALIILKSIKYNDSAIKLLLEDADNNANEEVIDIFNKDKEDNNYLEYDDTYVGDEETDYDPDVIN